jgi:hypothetical protein
MSYAHAVNRVTISGTCFGGAEEWSTGFWMGSETADAGDPNGAAEDIAGYWRTYFELAANSVSSGYITTEVKVAQHKADTEKTDLTKVDFYTVSPLMDGGGTATVLPAQITLAMTLTSEIQRGTASKGRMYLPGINAGLANATGKLLSSQTDTFRTNLKTMFDAINADADVPDRVILVSRGTKLTTFPGGDITYINPKNANVTGLRVGDVYDTQRRRRNSLVEAYSTAVLA